jgi:hypothetical protein
VGVDVNDHRNALPFTVAAQGAITHEDPTMEFFQLIGNAASKLLKRSANIQASPAEDDFRIIRDNLAGKNRSTRDEAHRRS